jgi:predicted transcriptional regulator
MSAMPRVLEIRVGAPGDALDRFEAAWNRLAEGRPMQPLRVLTLEDLPGLLKALSPARMQLVQALRAAGAVSIYELSKRLQRDYKNVHTDVAQLAALGLVARGEDGHVGVPWDVLRAELAF